MIVVDAGLAAKWMLWEEVSRAALRFLFQYRGQLRSPDTLFTEVAQVIVRLANSRKGIDKDIIEDAQIVLQKWTIAWGHHAVKPHRVTQRRL